MINCCDLALLLEVITFKYNCLLVRNKWINTICTTSPCYLHIRLLRDLFIYLFENPIQLKDLSLRKKKTCFPFSLLYDGHQRTDERNYFRKRGKKRLSRFSPQLSSQPWRVYDEAHWNGVYFFSLSFLKGRFYKAKQTKKNVQHTLQKYLCTGIIEY